MSKKIFGLRAKVKRPYINGVDIALTDGTTIEIRWEMGTDRKDDLRIHVEMGFQIASTETVMRKKKEDETSLIPKEGT